MKTATSCDRCEHSATCVGYDSRMLYGFCQGFVERGVDDQSNEPYGDEDIVRAEED